MKSLTNTLLLTLSMIVSANSGLLHGQVKPRARDVGVPLQGNPGLFNAITDVHGVEVGHTTLITGEGELIVGESRSDGSRFGVTSMDWSGTTLTVNVTSVSAEREIEFSRVTWEHSPDFKSVTATFETFTDGKWWISAKDTGKKVE